MLLLAPKKYTRTSIFLQNIENNLVDVIVQL